MSIVTTTDRRASSVEPVSPFDLVSRIEIKTAGREEVVSVDPDLLAAIDLNELERFRGGRSHVGAPNFSGKHFHSGLRRHVWFESRLEQQFVELTECDDSIVGLVAQPMKIHWVDAAYRDHVPDYLVRHHDGRLRIVNVRPAERVARSEPVFELVEAFARLVGVEAEVFTGLDADAQQELSFLHRFRLGRRRIDMARWSEPVTPRWVYEQDDASLVRDMWVAVSRGALTATSTVLDDDCILVPEGAEQ